MNHTRIYFIRTPDRLRILATLALRRHDDKSIRFAWAIASSTERSPSRKDGRKHALARLTHLEEAIVNNNLTTLYWSCPKLSDQDSLVIAGVVEHKDLIRTLRNSLQDNLAEQFYRPTSRRHNIGHVMDICDEYLDLFARIREDCVNGKF